MRRVLAGTGAAALAGVIGLAAWCAGSSTPTLDDRHELQPMPESELPKLVQFDDATEPQSAPSGNFAVQLVGWKAARRAPASPSANQAAHEAPSLLAAEPNAPQLLTPSQAFAEPGSLPLADASARPLTASEPTPLQWHQPHRTASANVFAEQEPASKASPGQRLNPLRSGEADGAEQAYTTEISASPNQLPWRDNPLR